MVLFLVSGVGDGIGCAFLASGLARAGSSNLALRFVIIDHTGIVKMQPEKARGEEYGGTGEEMHPARQSEEFDQEQGHYHFSTGARGGMATTSNRAWLSSSQTGF